MVNLRCETWNLLNPFPAPVFERMYQLTDGVPRLLLRLCALAVALSGTTHQPITIDLVEHVVADMELPEEEEHDREQTSAPV